MFRRFFALCLLLAASAAPARAADQLLPSPHVNAGQIYFPGNPNVTVPPAWLPFLPGATTAVPTDIAVFPIQPNTPGMVIPDTSRPYVITGNVTSLAGESPGGLLYAYKSIGGFQGYVTTTAAQASSGTTLTVASASNLYAGMSVNGATVASSYVSGGTTVPLTSALKVTRGQTLNFIGAGNGTAIDALITYNDGPNSNEGAINGQVNVTATHNSQGDGVHGASATGVSGACNMYVVNGIDCWPGLFVFNDLSGESNPAHAQYGVEIDNYGSGSASSGDSGQEKLLLQLSCNNQAFNPAVTNTCYDGIAFGTGPSTGTVAAGTFSSAGKYANAIDFGTSHSVNGINGVSAVFDNYALAFPGFRLDPHGNIIAQAISAAGYTEALTTPASSRAACTAGQFTDDANYHYVCVATSRWRRSALSDF